LDAAVLEILICAHKDWEDKVCYASGLKAILPLWQQDRITLVNEMIDNGIETMIVSCNTTMERVFRKDFNERISN
jgi:diphthamide synthase (EF-2-diphthine--ammonia ligase)